MTRGALIVIEGLDRTGKTTQTNQLIEKLNSIDKKIELVKFPQRETIIGKLINSYLTSKPSEDDKDGEIIKLNDYSIHLLFSANRWELIDKIKNLLEQGVTVLLDRYVYSGVAYSSAKGLDFDWCLSSDIGLIKPDKTIFLKFEELNNLQDREGFGDEKYEVKEFQEKVRIQFGKIENLEILKNSDKWDSIYVDNKSIKQVSDEIWEKIEKICVNGIEEELNFFTK
ncbi:hypothetical protein B5S32_g3670 [[Candida] boidinii]|uniref:Unnamed protein product n=1 Tax=Candida boidinii TaxID=5477 RepID=A0ACB5U6W9_CANBO|nr:hypothetical protein B5S29_g981 [[Candida] boidinii]OWB79448.1 hypothetical protein B5S32_g3670 [[Candida] boidinii]GMF00049.1 unnamed protein product [[Candida] boidinii]GMF02702.1 unnamed protein product [[Candida] boidinii]